MGPDVAVVRADAQEARARGRWAEVHRLLSALDPAVLEVTELDALADASWAVADSETGRAAREAAHARCVELGDDEGAAWNALFVAMDAFLRGDLAVAAGWSATAERFLEGVPESKAHARLLYGRAAVSSHLGDLDGAIETAREARDVARRVGSRDLEMLSLEVEGCARARRGEVAQGMELVDEAMVAVVSGNLAPWAAEPIACHMISLCQELGDVKRAAEWIETCDRVMVARGIDFSAECHLHRAGVLKVRGSWARAEAEARVGCAEHVFGWHIGWGWCEIGEIRLRVGDLDGADEAFALAHEKGYPPHPGYALLRLAQGDAGLAVTEIERALDRAVGDCTLRARILDAAVAIHLAAGDADAAERAGAELSDIAAGLGSNAFAAAATCTEGAVRSARGDLDAAARLLRDGVAAWVRLGVPYEAARARVHLARALQTAGDAHGARLELRAARSTFEELGAELDLNQVGRLLDELEDVAPDPSRGQQVDKTFMFTDIERSTALAEAMGEAEWDLVLRRHDRVLRDEIREHSGRVVKHEGDGVFAVFDAPSPAVRAAIAIQRRLDAQRRDDRFAPQVRIGLHRGRAIERHGDYFGMAVNTAARVMSLADGGEIVATDALADVGHDRASAPRVAMLKGLSTPTPVITIGWRPEAAD